MHYSEREKVHLKKLYARLEECTVLLKSNGDFPLSGPGRIALYGNGGRHTVRGGTGSGEVYSRHAFSVEEGLKKTGFTVTTREWLDAYDEIRERARNAFIISVQKRAKEKHTLAVLEGMGAVMPEPEYLLPVEGDGDTALYILSRICGEGNDREAVKGDILLTDTEVRDILRIREKYPKFMLVLNTGGPVDLTPVEAVENILLLSQLGDLGGCLLGDILLGKKNPSGHLTTTWTSWKDRPCRMEFGDPDDTRYTEGIYVGYRYYDTVGAKPMFPFGFGLSFTTFASGVPEVSLEGERVSVRAAVTNTGKYAGRQTLQLYLSKPQGRLDQPDQELAGWAKTKKLLPGQTQELTISFDMSAMASFDRENCLYVLEEGDYVLRLGCSSRENTPCGIVRLEKTMPVRKVRHALGQSGFEDFVPSGQEIGRESERAETLPEEIPVLLMNRDAIAMQEIRYDEESPVDPRVEKMTDDELIYLGIGAFDPKGGLLSVVGNAAKTVAGASGETTHQVEAVGSLVMADGPAGLRLSRKYWRDEAGAHSIGDPLLEGLMEFMPKYQQFVMKRLIGRKPGKQVRIQEQFTTALPIGTAIAQSWDLDFAEICGDIAGAEMEKFGIDLWLAPALNIHRSIQCGRNFEYFSEDPVISGYFAAAITKGVQQHPGCGVTIKHFAANNQEHNRFYSNSCVSERAMREIYLKGFEICIRESAPEAVMTSYNLLNGTHTSERRDLTTDILRAEFGFEGLVMTDWLVGMMLNKNSHHPAAGADRIAAAGGELVMPGGKGDFKKMKKGLQCGTITRRQLQINASRLLRIIDRRREK